MEVDDAVVVQVWLRRQEVLVGLADELVNRPIQLLASLGAVVDRLAATANECSPTVARSAKRSSARVCHRR